MLRHNVNVAHLQEKKIFFFKAKKHIEQQTSSSYSTEPTHAAVEVEGNISEGHLTLNSVSK